MHPTGGVGVLKSLVCRSKARDKTLLGGTSQENCQNESQYEKIRNIKARKKSTNSNIWVRISSGRGGGLPREGAGVNKFGKTSETKLFWPDIPGSCWDILAAPEKFQKNKKSVQIWPLNMARNALESF